MRHFFCDSLKRFFVACALTVVGIFSATATNLPSGYTELEYIESTGTQYIDTGITALETDEITVIGTATTTGSQFFFSQGASSNNQAFQLANTTATNGIVFDLQNYDPYRIITGVYAYNNVVTVRIANKEIFVNGTSYGTSAGTLTNPTDTMRLFISSAGVMYNIQMQRFTITGKIDLVPAKNSSGVIGMYDTVNNQFYTNQGTGAFIAGPTACPGGTLETRHESGLPVGYTKLDYIESSGKEYIDTGLYQENGDEFNIVYQQTTLDSTYRNIFGASNSGSDSTLYLSQTTGTTWAGNANNSQFPHNTSKHTLSWVTRNSSGSTLTCDGTNYSFANSITPSTTLTVKLFARSSLSTQGKMIGKIYSYKQKRNGSAIIDLVPVKRDSDNVVGMYDLVSGTFFTNAGTGEFIAGNTVSDPIVEQCVGGGGAIKIATTKYTEDAFAGLMTTLSEAITKVTNIVDTTVQQATEIGNLATTKQDRPDTDCPAGRKCLLIMGADNKPHWYLIQE